MTTLNAVTTVAEQLAALDALRAEWRKARDAGNAGYMETVLIAGTTIRDIVEETLDAEYRSFTQVERRQEAKAFLSDLDFQNLAASPAQAKAVENARYTVVFNPDADDRITLRVREGFVGDDGRRTPQTVSVLYGPDNSNDYVGVGFWKNGELRVWKKHQGTQRAARAAQAMAVIAGDPRAAMEAYAVQSSKCARCGRDLTVPASIYRGLGPECAKKVEG